jgi:hypothetical protein
MILYRGVNFEFHEEYAGRLVPKESGPFEKAPEFGKAEYGNSFWGCNEKNAVVEHQLHQAGYATSGISTTPHFKRAMIYASHEGKFTKGYVYEIDTDYCEKLGISVYVVSEIVPSPSIPEDDEVILVAKDFGELPIKIVTKIHEFGT